MNKAFDNFEWKALPSKETPTSAENLNKINNGLDIVDTRVVAFDTSKQNTSDSSLTTTDKTIVGSINEVNRSVSKINRRVTNLEGRAPASTIVSYPDATYGTGVVPSNVCKYANVQKIKGTTATSEETLLNSSIVSVVSKDNDNETLETITLPQTVTLRSDGTNADEYPLESGVITRNITTQLITGVTGDTITLTGCDTGTTTYLCGKGSVGVLSSGVLTLVSDVTNELIQFKLATPTTEEITPVNPYIEVQAGGTIWLTHNETPPANSAFDVEYANLT